MRAAGARGASVRRALCSRLSVTDAVIARPEPAKARSRQIEKYEK